MRIAEESGEFAHSWGFSQFYKYEGNPILKPGTYDWTSFSVYNPTVITDDDLIYLIFRAEGPSKYTERPFTSRIGLATSRDGFHFHIEPLPILGETEDYEIPGGCEDPRITKIDGQFILTYTAYDGKTARLAIAFGTDLHQWQKLGPVFPEKGWTKSGAIVPQKINGSYWMYFGDTNIWLAHSSDLKNWTVIEQPVLSPRKKSFDSRLVEPGPAPVITPKGILLIYNSADDNLRYSVGQALFDRANPAKLLCRSQRPILESTTIDEQTGQVPNVVFAEGLVHFKNRWLLYYGMADSRIGVAVSSEK